MKAVLLQFIGLIRYSTHAQRIDVEIDQSRFKSALETIILISDKNDNSVRAIKYIYDFDYLSALKLAPKLDVEYELNFNEKDQLEFGRGTENEALKLEFKQTTRYRRASYSNRNKNSFTIPAHWTISGSVDNQKKINLPDMTVFHKNLIQDLKRIRNSLLESVKFYKETLECTQELKDMFLIGKEDCSFEQYYWN